MAHQVGAQRPGRADRHQRRHAAGRPRPPARPRAASRNVECVQANAECLPFPDASFDCVTIAFGLRNVTDKPAALRSMRRVLKPGGRLLVLEFSQPAVPALEAALRRLFVRVLPLAGRRVAGDEASYRYLAESIRMHPGPGNPARHDGRGRSRGLPLPQPDRRHRRPASRLPVLTAAMLLERLEASLNRNVAASRRARALVRAARRPRARRLRCEGTPLTVALRDDRRQIDARPRARGTPTRRLLRARRSRCWRWSVRGRRRAARRRTCASTATRRSRRRSSELLHQRAPGSRGGTRRARRRRRRRTGSAASPAGLVGCGRKRAPTTSRPASPNTCRKNAATVPTRSEARRVPAATSTSCATTSNVSRRASRGSLRGSGIASEAAARSG